VRTRSELPDEVIRKSDAAAIFVKLRKMIAADGQETDTILGTIAVAAQSLTEATGAAIAMPRNGVVVCVGRSGETAPELGDRLDVDSGISGECLRTGVSLRCDDASRDFHVDAEVCREMGLQSIAVVPLRGQHGRVGVLEAFSTEAYAFDDDKMELLGRLAGLAEAAWARGMVPPEAVAEDSVAEGPTVAEATDRESTDRESYKAWASVALERVGEAIATGLHRERETERKLRYGAVAGLSVLILVLLSVIGWRTWYKASIESKPSHTVASPQVSPTETGSIAAGAGLAWKPDAEPAVSRPNAAPAAAHAVKSNAAARTHDAIIRRKDQLPQAGNSGASANTPDTMPPAEDPPQMAESGPSQTYLRNVLPTSPSLPKLGAQISQGVSGGVLIHKVQPVYPAPARSLHLEGAVILEATITEQGQLEDLKLISGHPFLAESAIGAVSQWRYTPFMLNGKPVRKQTRITISFMAPQ
jgi:TonB family protein